MNKKIFSTLSTVMALSITLLAGCDSGPTMDYSSVGLIDAYGVVTLDGQPLPNAVITFDAPDGTFAYGMTDSDGAYELNFDSEMQGVTPGPKTVRISTTRKILGLNADDGESSEEAGEEGEGAGRATDNGVERVPAKYNEASELTVDVTPAQTEYNFDLQSA